MIELADRLILRDGTVLCTDAAVLEMLMAGKPISGIVCVPSDDIALHNAADVLLDTNLGQLETAEGEIYGDVDWSGIWFTPEPHASMDIEQFCLQRCHSPAEISRVQHEMRLFQQRGMIPVLRHLSFLVEHWRSHGIFWGVGRGSSVSSFVLYLIGINRINPLRFDLEIEEFLK